VLGKWNEEEQKALPERLKLCSEAIKAFTFIGLERCMNQFNKA
jgi:PTH1 family peptidyl-tRNA hydrolase